MKKTICSQCKGNGYVKVHDKDMDCYYCNNQGELVEAESFEEFRKELAEVKRELSISNELRWFAEKDRDFLLQEYKIVKKELRMLYDFLELKGYDQKEINSRENKDEEEK